MVPVTVSVALTVCAPAVFSVTPDEKVCVPLSPPAKVKLPGSTAKPSVDVSATVPV